VDEDGRVRSTANPYRFAKPEPAWARIPRPRPEKEGKAP
jgi:hypothetical protein